MKITFSVHRRNKLLRTVTVSDSVVKIGTDPRAQLSVDDEQVLRAHAVLEITDSAATLIDLGSEGGTWVNGARVNRCKLQPGDDIRLGNTLLSVKDIEA